MHKAFMILAEHHMGAVRRGLSVLHLPTSHLCWLGMVYFVPLFPSFRFSAGLTMTLIEFLCIDYFWTAIEEQLYLACLSVCRTPNRPGCNISNTTAEVSKVF